MKRKLCILLYSSINVLNIQAFKQSPEIQAGIQINYANNRYFNDCKGLYLQVGYNISKHICLSIYGTGFRGNQFNVFYPTWINYGMNGGMLSGKNDTFHNITSKTSYSASQILFRLRINLFPEKKLNIYLQPAIGFTGLKETIEYDPAIIEKSVYSGEYTCLHIGAGASLALDKDKKLRICTEFQSSITFSENVVLDGYNPAFNYDNTVFRQMSFGLNYRFN